MDLSVRPQDDFFRYVNGRWVDNTPIPADQSGYGSFAILRERAQEAVRGIIEAEGRVQAAPGSNSQKVGDLYKSFMDEARIETLGITPLNGELAAIAKINDSRDLPAAFARRGADRRSSAIRGERRSRPAQLRTERRAGFAVGTRHARSRLLPADRREVCRDPQGLHDLHRQALRAGEPARSRRRRRAHRRARNQDRAAAMGSRPQSRSQRHLQQDGRRHRCRRRRRTSTGRRTWRRCPPAQRTRSAR